MPFDLQLRHNIEHKEGSADPRYFLDIDLSPVLPRPAKSKLGVYYQSSPGHPLLKEVYWVEIAGKRLEKGNLPALTKAIPELIASMVDFRTFPYYYLVYPGGEPTPVFHSEGKLRLKLEGVEISGYEIGEVWQQAADRLIARRRCRSREELEVHLLLWQDLKLYPSAFILSHPKVWIPIFYQAGGTLIYDVIGAPSQFFNLKEAFELRRQIARSLVAARQASNTWEVSMEQVQPPIWAQLEQEATPTGLALTYYYDGTRAQIPIYQTREEFFAVEGETKRRLVFSSDPDSLRNQISQELSRKRIPTHSPLTIEKLEVGNGLAH